MGSVASVAPGGRSGEASPGRRFEIDGIRGWAALCVLIFHLSWETFGVVLPYYRADIVRLPMDGTLSVYIFFVLSGDALSLAFTAPTRRGLGAHIVVKRYFRLAGPILLSCATVYVLMTLGLIFNVEAAPIVDLRGWLGVFLPFEPSFVAMLNYSLIGVFTNHGLGNSYNPFLWPMGIELAGSMLVFCLYQVWHRLKAPLMTVMVMAVVLTLLGSLYALFLYGVCLGVMRQRGLFARLQQILTLNRIASAGAVVAICFVHAQIFDPLQDFPARIALAAAIVFVCYASRDILGWMRSPVSRFLGRISFPLYYMQFAVIASWMSWCIVLAGARPDLLWATSPPIIISSAALVFAAAIAASRLEEAYLRAVDRAIDRWILRPDDEGSHSQSGAFSSEQLRV